MPGACSEMREQFITLNGYWSPAWAFVLERDACFFAACIDLMAAPAKLNMLDAKTRELINIAINVACTHLSEEGIRQHIRRAIAEGVTSEEIAETIQLASVLGIHSCTVGIPMLLDQSDSGLSREATTSGSLEPSQLQLKQRFIEKRGYWSSLWDGLLTHSEAFFEAYLNFSSVPWSRATLSPKAKELIYIAIDIATSHLFEPGTKLHINNAIKHGASTGEILEVIETVSLLGLQSIPLGYAILEEEVARASAEGNS